MNRQVLSVSALLVAMAAMLWVTSMTLHANPVSSRAVTAGRIFCDKISVEAGYGLASEYVYTNGTLIKSFGLKRRFLIDFTRPAGSSTWSPGTVAVYDGLTPKVSYTNVKATMTFQNDPMNTYIMGYFNADVTYNGLPEKLYGFVFKGKGYPGRPATWLAAVRVYNPKKVGESATLYSARSTASSPMAGTVTVIP